MPYADGQVVIEGGHYGGEVIHGGPIHHSPIQSGPVGGGFVITSDPACGCEGPVCDGGCDGCGPACGPACGGLRSMQRQTRWPVS